MEQTEKTNLFAKQVLYLISAHSIIYLLYHYAHGKIDVLYALTESMPVFFILCCVPLMSVIFLFMRMARQGAIILLGILPAELIYNIYTRFTSLEPMYPQKPAVIWKMLFEGSFGMVLILEVVAFWITVNLLREIHKHMTSSLEN
jgi:hypothetical protein